jgi:hypothetical protein
VGPRVAQSGARGPRLRARRGPGRTSTKWGRRKEEAAAGTSPAQPPLTTANALIRPCMTVVARQTGKGSVLLPVTLPLVFTFVNVKRAVRTQLSVEDLCGIGYPLAGQAR